jgi:hypothetical protein
MGGTAVDFASAKRLSYPQGGPPTVKKNLTALAALAAFLAVASFAGAQANPVVLSPSDTWVTVDGVSAASEYTATAEIGKTKLSLARDKDNLYVSITGETTGWLSVGFGSLKMDGALLFIGFVSADGKAQGKIQKGTSSHTHADAASDALVQFAMKEAGGMTTLELVLKASSVIANGATSLPIVWAVGTSDSFSALHKARGSLTLTLK